MYLYLYFCFVFVFVHITQICIQLFVFVFLFGICNWTCICVCISCVNVGYTLILMDNTFAIKFPKFYSKRGVLFTKHCCSPGIEVVAHIMGATVVTGRNCKVHALIKVVGDLLSRSHPIGPIIRSSNVFETAASNTRPAVVIFDLLWQQLRNLRRFITSHRSSSSTTFRMASFILQTTLCKFNTQIER